MVLGIDNVNVVFKFLMFSVYPPSWAEWVRERNRERRRGFLSELSGGDWVGSDIYESGLLVLDFGWWWS